jgi:hypothetical protein
MGVYASRIHRGPHPEAALTIALQQLRRLQA